MHYKNLVPKLKVKKERGHGAVRREQRKVYRRSISLNQKAYRSLSHRKVRIYDGDDDFSSGSSKGGMSHIGIVVGRSSA